VSGQQDRRRALHQGEHVVEEPHRILLRQRRYVVLA
jgi:hypothetical protein